MRSEGITIAGTYYILQYARSSSKYSKHRVTPLCMHHITAHSKQHTQHSARKHKSQHNTNWSIHTAADSREHCPHRVQRQSDRTCPRGQNTQHTAHSTQHTAHSTQHTAQHSTAQHTAYTYSRIHRTWHTAHSTRAQYIRHNNAKTRAKTLSGRPVLSRLFHHRRQLH